MYYTIHSWHVLVGWAIICLTTAALIKLGERLDRMADMHRRNVARTGQYNGPRRRARRDSK